MTHADFEHSAVTDEARCGFLPMLAVMLGFTFFSASMVVGVAMFAVPTTMFLMDVPALQGSWWLAGGTLELAGTPPLPLRCVVPIAAVSGALMTSSAYFGMRTLKIVSVIAVPSIVLLGGWSVVRALRFDGVGGLDALLHHTPAADSAIGFGMAVSLGIGSFVSGGTCTPDFTRFARKPSAAALATVIAFLFGNSLMFLFGAVAAMVYGQEDISTVLCLQGLLVPAIAVLGLNIWTTNDNAIYTAGLGLSNITGLPKRHLVLACGFLGTLSSVCLYAHFCGWLNILNCTLPPVGIILVLDYFLNKKNYESVETECKVNWASIAGVVLGAVVANVLNVGISSINGMAVAAVCYLIGYFIKKSAKKAA